MQEMLKIVNQPKQWQLQIVVLTIGVDIAIITFEFFLFISLASQIASMVKLVIFIMAPTKVNAAKVYSLYLIFGIIGLLYLHDSTKLLFYFWGLPASNMTHKSEKDKKLINSYDRCTVNLDDYSRSHQQFLDVKTLLKISQNVTEYSRLTFTLVLYTCMIYL